MKIIKLFFGLIAIIIIGGFTFVAFTDVPIETSSITETVSNDRFFDDKK